MQHQYWITKQTLSRKLGRKEDECIVSSDAQLDTKLELFRNIQMSCSLIQRIIDKYQESICFLSQETSSIGRFLKENSIEDSTNAGKIMLIIGKSLIVCAQQQLILHEPLLRFYQELDTFRQRAIGDTLQNVLGMEKARTEYRASLSWMKNISQQLDPDTTKQLEKFKKVQNQVRRGKIHFDKLALDCLQKVDLLAAARCNMLNHSLGFYQNKITTSTEKLAKAYSTIIRSFDNQYNDRTLEEIHTENLTSRVSLSDITQIHENQLVLDEKHSTTVDNIDTQNMTSNSFNSSSKKCKDDHLLSSLYNTVKPSSSEKETSIISSEHHILDYYDKFHELLILESNNVRSTSSTDETKDAGISRIDCNTQDLNNFFPSSLLNQNFENIGSSLKGESRSFPVDKINVELPNKKYKGSLWLNMFEDLDPLSSNPAKTSYKYKNSFV